MARKTTAAERAEMDREMAKIAAVALRPKTMTELAAEWEASVQECKSLESEVELLEQEAARKRQALEAARTRRTAAWQAIESVGGAA